VSTTSNQHPGFMPRVPALAPRDVVRRDLGMTLDALAPDAVASAILAIDVAPGAGK
jgi:hypothetical protein